MLVTRTPVEQLNELIRGFKFGMLATVHADGTVHSRPMVTHEADVDGHLWFFTHGDSDKTDAIRENDNVGVAYVDPGGHYISVSGRAQLLNKPEKKAALWNPLYKEWFPRGLDDPQLVLIRVLITAVDYWDSSQGKMVKLSGFDQATFSGEQYQAAEHREIELPPNRRDQTP